MGVTPFLTARSEHTERHVWLLRITFRVADRCHTEFLEVQPRCQGQHREGQVAGLARSTLGL